MKKMLIVCGCALFLGGVGVVVGQQRGGRMGMGGGGQGGDRPPMGPGPMQRMMGPLMQKQVVATSDGGVVVVIGNRIVKYDATLKKVGEAEIDISEQTMAEMQERMKQCCKMMMEQIDREKAQAEKAGK